MGPLSIPLYMGNCFFSHPYKVAVLTDSYMKDLTFHSLIFINIGSWYDLPAVYLRLMLEDWLCPTPPPPQQVFFLLSTSRLKEAQKGVAWPNGSPYTFTCLKRKII